MRLLLFICFLFPVCAMAQIEVVNESMTCDSNSNVLEIGKFNYLRFKNLPDSSFVSVSTGIIKPYTRLKSAFYIPGQKAMEGRTTKLTVVNNGRQIFSKDYQFIFPYLRSGRDSLIPLISLGPYQFHKSNFAKTFIIDGEHYFSKDAYSLIFCKDSLKQNPFFHSSIAGIEIISFLTTIFYKRQDVVGPIYTSGNTFKKISDDYLIGRPVQTILIENLLIRFADGTEYCYPEIILKPDLDCWKN